MYILDTDHVSLWLENHPVVRRKTAEYEADLAITIITVQELFNGWIGRLNHPDEFNQQGRLCLRLRIGPFRRLGLAFPREVCSGMSAREREIAEGLNGLSRIN